ncbi:MAG: hypothetical protein II889_04705 [Clostridia bacterium]|nr:hypothetical protein [Clostridia bacterium]MCR4905296.1 hypothetical protein [Clostridiales bacterium]
MIKLEHTAVMNLENALRGMRNPMNSWAKSDSYEDEAGNYVIGEADLDLAERLAKSGTDHRKYLRMIFVSVDVTAPLYWWKEYDTYKVGTVANSTSTMHKIHAKPFSREDFSCDRMSPTALACLDHVIEVLEGQRLKFLETKDTAYWHDMIQLLPTSYNQMRTTTLNYETLINIYYARRNHKLPEWHTYCDWIAGLPYADHLITNLK